MIFSRWLLGFTLVAAPALAQSPLSAPTTPTAMPGNNSNTVASTAFVAAAVANAIAQPIPPAAVTQNSQQIVSLVTGGTAQTVIAANGALPGGYVYNIGTTAACVNFGAAAGTPIAPVGAGTGSCTGGGGTYLEPNRGYTLPVGCQSVSVNTADTGHLFQVRAWSYVTPAAATAQIAACAATASAGTTLTTTLALTHSYAVTSTLPGEVVSYVTGALPGTVLTMTDTAGALGIASAPATAGTGVRLAATATIPAGDDTVTVTETLATYAPKSTTFTIHAVPQNISGPAFTLATYANTAAPYFTTNYPTHPSIYNPTTNPTNYDFYDYQYSNDQQLSSICNSVARGGSSGFEIEQYSGPACDGIDPFTTMPGGGLKITAKVLPGGTFNITGDARYSSGMLMYKTPYRSYCTVTRFSYTLPQGAFPAASWAYPPLNLGPAEDDTHEAGWARSDGSGTNNPQEMTRGKHDAGGDSTVANQDNFQHLYLNPDPTQAFHTITSCHLPPNGSGKMYVVEMLDGVITTTVDTPTSWTGNTSAGGDVATPKLFYQQMDLAVGTNGDGVANPDIPAQFPAYLYLDSLSIYPSIAQATKPPFGQPSAPINNSFTFGSGTTYSVTYNLPFMPWSEPIAYVQATWRPQGTTTWPAGNAVGSGTAGFQNITIPAATNVDFGVFSVSPSGATSPVAYAQSVTVISPEARPAATPAGALAYDDFNRVDVAPAVNPSALGVDPAVLRAYIGSPAGIASHQAYFGFYTSSGNQSLDAGTQTEKTCITATLGGADMLVVLHRDNNGLLYSDLKNGVTNYYSIGANTTTAVGSTFTGTSAGTHVFCMRDVGSGSNNIIVSLDGATVNTGTWTGTGTQTGWIEQGGTPGTLRVSLLSVTPN